MLAHLPRPSHSGGSVFLSTKGFRLIDLRTLRVSLEKAQGCECRRRGATLSLTEVSPHTLQEDLATQLALTCSQCGKVTAESDK